MRIGIGPRPPRSGIDAPVLRTTIRQDSPDAVDAPWLAPWKMTDAFAAFGDEAAGERNRETVALLKGLSPYEFKVQAVVEPKKPLGEKRPESFAGPR
ncbi:hypothetical protein ACFQ08_12200 [Streptosporangium algeriense]|uniref:Uncharacterized protein n=1 Tax=Streptosporangium algeriense TaxID=1682748 RepID=A0ABW3DRL0_9ACTN